MESNQYPDDDDDDDGGPDSGDVRAMKPLKTNKLKIFLDQLAECVKGRFILNLCIV